MYNCINEEQLMRLVNCLLKCHSNARTYSNFPVYRTVLWKTSFRGQNKPNLEKLEARSIHCALNILFQLFMQSNKKLYREKLQTYNFYYY